MAEQQDCVDQISLLQSKLLHLEETIKLEEQEGKLKEKMEIHQKKRKDEAELIERKEKERAADEIRLQEEEGVTRKIVKKMVSESSPSLSPITKYLAHFEGFYYFFFFC